MKRRIARTKREGKGCPGNASVTRPTTAGGEEPAKIGKMKWYSSLSSERGKSLERTEASARTQ